jgi:hypothetical protein
MCSTFDRFTRRIYEWRLLRDIRPAFTLAEGDRSEHIISPKYDGDAVFKYFFAMPDAVIVAKLEEIS